MIFEQPVKGSTSSHPFIHFSLLAPTILPTLRCLKF